jgi:hypothetical protein
MKPFRPEHYYRAALERMAQSVSLYTRDESYSLCMYVAGLAVECLLRAFRLLHDPTFDEGHDIQRLYKASGIHRVNRASLAFRGFTEEEIDDYLWNIRSAVNDVALLWANDYRFASEERLRTHLKKNVELRRGVRGEILKACALRLVNAAQTIVNKGSALWPSRRK